MLQEKKKKNTFVAENAENMQGEMLEWLKRHAWKACIRQKCIRGSNPCLSAINAENQQIVKQAPNFTPKSVKLGAFVLFKIYT